MTDLTNEQLQGLRESILDGAETEWRDEDIAAIVEELIVQRNRVALLDASLKSLRKVLAADEDDCFPGTVSVLDEILLKSAEMIC